MIGFLIALLMVACIAETNSQSQEEIVVGASQYNRYSELIQGKTVGLVVNQSSQTPTGHLVDFLLSKEVKVKAIFSPEHGFRGDADAGEEVKDSIDEATGLSLFSLYGKSKKPTEAMLKGIDIMLFDLQDVGARFYTYISTLHYVMEACAEQDIPLIVLDRPNPNGFYIDGPVLDPEFSSFVGMHPVPVVHGMTIAEYALMINGEGWLKSQACRLHVISCLNYDHNSPYELPVSPSPNLPNRESVYLYPSLCFFEGTIVSVGRGTSAPFQQIGYPNSGVGEHRFTPMPNKGASKPRYQGQECRGLDLRSFGSLPYFKKNGLQLEWLIEFYEWSKKGEEFFERAEFFDLLSGSSELREAIIAGKSAADIKRKWEADLESFKTKRKHYLLYDDFE